MKFIVYKHTSPSGKSYIGVTNNLPRRNLAHQAPNSNSSFFYRAINKYGWDNFTHEVLETVNCREQANGLEIKYILEHNTLAPAGYNLTTGGQSYSFSDVVKIKMKGRINKETFTPMAIFKKRFTKLCKKRLPSEPRLAASFIDELISQRQRGMQIASETTKIAKQQYTIWHKRKRALLRDIDRYEQYIKDRPHKDCTKQHQKLEVLRVEWITHMELENNIPTRTTGRKLSIMKRELEAAYKLKNDFLQLFGLPL